ncbi:hypothetical protein GQ55_3G426200 [Panicum hallii var. hallii]|uniref:Uncharacterized protein n=1 Tax=Panicum hallii var. hallii TaxID=1504633 RepID=A0A2T7EHN5_9POAL|nr:hypothetical protein GQ55_3G426200 [Panicum hallii var. hallii]
MVQAVPSNDLDVQLVQFTMYALGGTTRHRRLRRAARVRLAGQSMAGGPRHSRTVNARFLRHLPLKSQFCHLPTALRRRPPRLRRPAAATARSIPSSLTAVNHGAGAQRKMSSSWLLLTTSAGNSCLCQRTLLHTLIRTAEQVNHCLKLQEVAHGRSQERRIGGPHYYCGATPHLDPRGLTE